MVGEKMGRFTKMFSNEEDKISELPESIGALQQLEKIQLQHQNLTRVPDSFYELSKLQELDLLGNPLSRKTQDELRIKYPFCEV